MIISMPFPFTIYRAWKRGKYGDYKSREYLEYLANSFADLKLQNLQLINSAYSLEVYLHNSFWITKPKSKKDPGHLAKKDVDNYLKVLLDTIIRYCEVQKIDFDDSNITELHVYKKQDEHQKKAIMKFTQVNFPIF